MNAKWYHIVTLKIRVRNSSSCSSERVVKKQAGVRETSLGFQNLKTTPKPASNIFRV